LGSPRDKQKKALETGMSLHRGLENLEGEGGSFPGEFERQMTEGSGNGEYLSKEALREEPGGRASILSTPRHM
jgi:hypothetical protein